MNNIVRIITKYKTFLISFILSFLIFLFLFFVYYPGIMTYDGNIQWTQVQSGFINNYHPFFSTFFLLLLSKIHNTTTIVYFYQMFIYSFIWGLACQIFYPQNKKVYILIIISILFSFIPIFSIYTFTLWKDILYTYYLFLIGFVFYLRKSNKNKLLNNLFLAIFLSLVFSYRLNGMIVYCLFIILILIFSILKNNKFFVFKDFIQIFIISILILCFIKIPKTIYINNYNNHYNIKSDKYIYPIYMNYELWILGSHIKNNNISNKEDLELLNNIISIEEWKDIYNPYLINKTNESVNKQFVYLHQKEINNIFFKTSIKHPFTVINHYLKSDSLLINPITIDSTYVYVYTFSDWSIGNYSFGLMETSKLPSVQKIYNKIINITFKKPLVYFYCPALVLLLSVVFCFVIDKRLKLKNIYFILIPSIFNTISLLPINLAQDLRYVFINYVSFIVLLSIFLFNLKDIFKKNNNDHISNLKRNFISNSNKYIAIFSAYYYPHLGGIERYIDGMMKYLINLGYNPILITTNYNNTVNEEMINGIKVFRIPVYNLFKNRYPIIKHNKEFKYLLKRLDEYDISSIIVNTRFHLTSHVGALYGKKHNIPVYLIEHGSQYVTLDNKFIDFFANRYEDILTFKIKKYIKGFYGVSEGASKWIKRFNIDYSGIWYNSIDAKQDVGKRIKHKGINFLYAGRLIKQKGIDNVLEAFEKLNKKYNNIHIFIAGDGPELEYLKSKYNNINIEFLGKLDYKTLCNYYLKTDIFLYPPLWPEGLPTSILEAGLMGCCVIGTKQGGIIEIIKDKENGVLCDGSVNGLTKSMKLLIENKDIRNEYAKKLNETISNKFSWDNTINIILNDINRKG